MADEGFKEWLISKGIDEATAGEYANNPKGEAAKGLYEKYKGITGAKRIGGGSLIVWGLTILILFIVIPFVYGLFSSGLVKYDYSFFIGAIIAGFIIFFSIGVI